MQATRALKGHPKTDLRRAALAVAAVQVVLGYEWLSSGLTKLVRGDFPGGLAGQLGERATAAAGWYRAFLHSAVIPHAQAFGYGIEIAELAIGFALIVTALLSLTRRMSESALIAMAAAALAGAALNVNFHLADGGSLPFPIAAESFDEAIDLDVLMAVLQIVFVVFGISVLVELRRARPSSRKEIHMHKRAYSKVFMFLPLFVGLALGAVLFGRHGATASATPAQQRDLVSLEAKLSLTQQDARYWTQLTSVFKRAPAHLRSMQDHRLYMLPSGIILGLHFDNMNLAKAKNLNWVVFGVPGRFTKADQARVTRDFGPGFVHFHDFVADTHGGKPGAKGFWFVHIGARNFRSPFGQVRDGVIDPTMMPTPPPR